MCNKPLITCPTTDTSASLAAISAKLATVIPPAESEIARINREARKNAKAKQAKPHGDPANGDPQQQQQSQDDGAPQAVGMLANLTTTTGGTTSPDGTNASSNSPQKSPTTKSSPPITTSLHESIIAEEWVNVHLETSGMNLIPVTELQAYITKPLAAAGHRAMLRHANDANGDDDDDDEDDDAATFSLRKKGGDAGPLARAGIDRRSLYKLGMPKDLVDRLYRALYVYTNGFHNIIKEIASHCPSFAEKHVAANVWLTFLLLLEQCEDGKYEMAMLKFNQATSEWKRDMQHVYQVEKQAWQAQLDDVTAQRDHEVALNQDKSQLLAKLALDLDVANAHVGCLCACLWIGREREGLSVFGFGAGPSIGDRLAARGWRARGADPRAQTRDPRARRRGHDAQPPAGRRAHRL